MTSPANRQRILLAVGLGAAFGASLSSVFLHSGMPAWVRLSGFLLFSLTGAGLAWLLLTRMLLPGLARYPQKIRLAWFGLCLLAGFFLVLNIPWSALPQDHAIQIVATGAKNPAAERSEVWLSSITTDRQAFSGRLKDICTSGWYIIEGKLVSAENQPAAITCHVRSNGPILLKFGMHRWAGEVNLTAGSVQLHKDLYSAEGDTWEVSLPGALTPLERTAQAGLILANTISLAVLLLALTVFTINRPAGPISLPTGKARFLSSWWVFALFLAAAWGMYLVIYWPGFFTTDTLSQFKQLDGSFFNDWHPAFHTMTLWLITRAWFTPASVILVQIGLLSSLLGLGFNQIVRRGAPLWLAWLGAIFLGFSPGIAWILLNPWKDVAYTIALIGLTLLFFMVFTSRGAQLTRPWVWVGIGVCVALSALYRHNGAPVAFGSLLMLAIAYPKRWNSLAGALAVALIIFLGVKGPLYAVTKVSANNPDPLSTNPGIPSTSFLLLDYQQRAGITLDPAIIAKMDEVLGQPTIGDGLIFLARYGADFNREAERLALAHPFLTLGFGLERSKYIFQVLQPPLARLGYVEPVVEENPFGFHEVEISPWVKFHLSQLIFLTETPYLDWLFWRNAFWMYALIIGAVVAWVRTRDLRVFLLIIPVLFNALPLAIFSGGHIARYILPTLIVGPWLGGYLLTINLNGQSGESR